MLELLLVWYFMKKQDKICMRKLGLLLCFSIVVLNGFSQVRGKALNLIGKWEIKGGSGYEIWSAKDDYLSGYGFRKSKFGDSSKVEVLTLKMVNGTYVYDYKRYLDGKDHSQREINFIAKGKRLTFQSSNTPEPILLTYKLNLKKKRLKITVQHGLTGKKQKMILLRTQ